MTSSLRGMARAAALAATAVVAALSAAAPARAQQADAANGETQFNRQCVACHVVRSPDGRTLAGRTAETGPNLYGVAGRQPGSLPGFVYGDALVAYGQRGTSWGEGNFTAYIQSPTGFLREALDDRRARARMAYEVRDPADARDIWAYLSGLPSG
ncbi:c-type cytochrome [Wenxinia saemankumensis]|uniref:Cytochrome c n=1 Tax=Wenxinia saemankumensis TaxID=1447782 RepID=A0A1M6ELV4_9RHOB|nr:cytochrome C [Wenxinia saemankumensis]SHI86190.1 cytochrome c [Wenxinia saemankumensis]